MTAKPLTPETFDALTRAHARDAREERIIWTLPAIGKRIGRGRDFAEALAMMPDTPIRKQGRQYFVIETELIAYMKASGLRRPARGQR